jgi:uroporphyrin-III C-methyltransferase/precorrin-2 dehydrogenase/sirohydrochlorin ferrochelatase
MTRLNTFPLSFKVKGKRIMIVGGTDEALNKVRLVAKTTASIEIYARQVETDFSGFDVTVFERPLTAEDVAGVALVFVADEGPDGQLAMAEARRRRSR